MRGVRIGAAAGSPTDAEPYFELFGRRASAAQHFTQEADLSTANVDVVANIMTVHAFVARKRVHARRHATARPNAAIIA